MSGRSDAWPRDRAAAALDANFAELIRLYAGRPGGQVRRHPDVSACSTGLAFRAVNGAVGIDLKPSRADERIADVTRWFAARNDPWRWLVGPTSGPLDLGRRLERAGFERLRSYALPAGSLTGRGWPTLAP